MERYYVWVKRGDGEYKKIEEKDYSAYGSRILSAIDSMNSSLEGMEKFHFGVTPPSFINSTVFIKYQDPDFPVEMLVIVTSLSEMELRCIFKW